MTAILINDDEWALLAGEPAELLKLYVAIKRRMDFATGVAGRKTLLNEIVLREGFTVDPIPGRPSPKPVTREQYRSAVRRLERIGALTVIGPLVFEFPYARKDAPPKRATTELQPDWQPELQPASPPPQASKSAVRTSLRPELQPDEQPGVGPSYNLLPESGKSIQHTHNARERFAMLDDWEPSPDSFSGVLYRNGMANQTFEAHQLLEFRSYWIANPDTHRTQAQWEHALAQQLKRQSRHTQAQGMPNEARGRTTRSRTRNAHDILTDTSW